MSGYVKVSRAIFGHGMFKKEPYTEVQAWIWFICGASYKDDTVRVGHLIVDVKRGEYVASIRFLARKFKWTTSRVKRFLDRLTRGKMVTTKATQGITSINLMNYDEYQFFIQPTTHKQGQVHIKSDTNISKEVNKINIYTSQFELYWSSIPSKMRKGKGKAYKAFKKSKYELTIEELSERYRKHHELNGEFTKHPATWLNQECWLDDEVQNSIEQPTLIDRMQKLGYKHYGSEGNYEQFIKDDKKYKVHRFQKNAQIELDS